MLFYPATPLFTENEIQALENDATNAAELFIIRRFLEDHARRSVTETKESICQSGDTEFLASNVNRICCSLTKHPQLSGSRPNVERLVARLSDFVLAKARQSVGTTWRQDGASQGQFHPGTYSQPPTSPQKF